jgi:hypothetical protein
MFVARFVDGAHTAVPDDARDAVLPADEVARLR